MRFWRRCRKKCGWWKGRKTKLRLGFVKDMASYNFTCCICGISPIKILYSSYYGEACFASLSAPYESITPRPWIFLLQHPLLDKPLSLFRPVWKSLVLLRCLPLLNKRQEVRLTGDVFPQNLWNNETLWCLVVLKNTAKSSLSSANYHNLISTRPPNGQHRAKRTYECR